MDEIAKIIRLKREEYGYSIEELSRKLCIKSQYLTAIENCDYVNLPKQVYVNGYIKNCVDFLKIKNYNNVIQIDDSYNNLDSKRNDNRDYKNPSYHSIIFSIIMLGIVYNIWHKQFNNQNMISEIRSSGDYVMQRLYDNNDLAFLRQNNMGDIQK